MINLSSTRWLAAAAFAMALLAPSPGVAAGKPKDAGVDHSKFAALQENFATGQEVTRACLTCHAKAAKEIHQTQHWKWEYKNPTTGQLLGKRHVVNNFCTSAASNYDSCGTCHISYGMKDEGFDFASEQNVDCLVCHDTTGKHRKEPGLGGNVVGRDMELPPGSGKIVKAIDLRAIAQHVGKTSRATCGACHFNGGGGDGVKHGDLDSSLESPEKALDVHMDADGNNFGCATCHQTDGHQVPGSRYAPTAQDKGGAHLRGKADPSNPATCQACHGQTPHKAPQFAKLNDHTAKIACQTCHIPKYARGGIPTKMTWDWSTAGRAGTGRQAADSQGRGRARRLQRHEGQLHHGRERRPGIHVVQRNGEVHAGRRQDRGQRHAGRQQPLRGQPDDGKSRIWPMKVFRGKQAYDPVNKSLVVTHLAGNDDTAYWKNLNWEKAISSGMATAHLPFSGKVAFVATESTWPITHMVAPAKDALKCEGCHASGGRLDKVTGVYLPGRGVDHASWLDLAGWILAALTLAGVLTHGAARVFKSRQRNSGSAA